MGNISHLTESVNRIIQLLRNWLKMPPYDGEENITAREAEDKMPLLKFRYSILESNAQSAWSDCLAFVCAIVPNLFSYMSTYVSRVFFCRQQRSGLLDRMLLPHCGRLPIARWKNYHCIRWNIYYVAGSYQFLIYTHTHIFRVVWVEHAMCFPPRLQQPKADGY